MRIAFMALGSASLLFAIAAIGSPTMGASTVDTRPHGAILFENRCARCHGLNGDGDGGLGPSLIGVMGQPIARQQDFIYSAALKAKGGIWTPDKLDHYLADPQAFAPGADMEVNSPDPHERAALVAYVTALK